MNLIFSIMFMLRGIVFGFSHMTIESLLSFCAAGIFSIASQQAIYNYRHKQIIEGLMESLKNIKDRQNEQE